MPKDFNYIFGFNGYTPLGGLVDIADKKSAVKYYTAQMLNRLQGLFEYEGLPDTIPARMAELFLQTNGFGVVGEYKDNLYVFFGGLGGMPDEYYQPTLCTVANPALKLSRVYNLGVDSVLIRNDSLMMGLLPLLNRYATLISENDISIRIAEIKSRLVDYIIAPDDQTKASAEEYLKQVIRGELGIIGDKSFFDGIRVLPSSSGSTNNIITQIIELQQYLKASMYNDLGLSANYNMKREAINSGEAQLGEDSMMTLIDDMLRQRQEGWAKVNKMFGTNVSVKLSGVWEKKEQAEDTELAILESEEERAEGVENSVETVEEVRTDVF